MTGDTPPSTLRVCLDGTTSCATMRRVRIVADAWGRAEQINHYYPYGLIHKPS
ncbi:MAG: hypothetical protein J6B03_02165 [Candidatus Homeothermus sp.]|nr:hypothetical protein [Candidatus Homeothermus sp.]